MSNVTNKHCVPCEGGVAPLTRAEAEAYLANLSGWSLNENATAITKTVTRKDFAGALMLVNAIGEIAENEGHHPDVSIHNYNSVTITLSTHSIGGLSENDFIMAAKIEEV
ncbi:MAG: 4a-hydroxytetrahydrobiopterin dehydratase [Candidatus Paceibacterota bacterium]